MNRAWNSSTGLRTENSTWCSAPRTMNTRWKPCESEPLTICSNLWMRRTLLRVPSESRENSSSHAGKTSQPFQAGAVSNWSLQDNGTSYAIRTSFMSRLLAATPHSTSNPGNASPFPKTSNASNRCCKIPCFTCTITHLVRLASVQSYNHRNGTLHLQNGKEVPIAVRKRDAVRQRLVELMIEVREGPELPMAAEDAPSMG